MKKRIWFVAAMTSLCVSALTPLFAQDGQAAITIPRSNRVIKGQLTLANQKAQFVVRDGTWVTVEDQKTGLYYGFAGFINDKADEPKFKAFRLLRTSDGTIAVEITRPVKTPLRKIIPFPIANNIKLVATDISEWQFSMAPITDPSQYSDSELIDLFGNTETSDSLCCQSCDGITVCATAVATSCGSCNGGGRSGFEPY